MYRDEISIDTFSIDVLSATEYSVDVNALLGVCGASPIRVHYKTDTIVVTTTYPESILLKSGDNYINISQIQKIVRSIDEKGKVAYDIVCGRLKEFETTVKIAQT